jgi:DNA-binding Lrp family transcriptional regulator
MQKLSEDLHRQAASTWSTVSYEIENNFGLNSSSMPSSIYLVTEEEQNRVLKPAELIENCIAININIPNYSDILPVIITKLCLQSSLSIDLLCEECINDLSFEFARQTINDDVLRAQWESIWLEHSPRRKISNVREYHPSAAYRWLYSIAGDNGINTFIRELTQRVRNQQPLSFDEYLQYFSARIHRFENTLDATELKLVKALVEKPNVKASNLTRTIGISQEWISKKIKQLQKRMILRKFYRPPFSKIGIQMFHVLIGRATNDEDPFLLFKNCPFLYSYRNVVSGPWLALVTLCIPDNQQSLSHLKQGLHQIEKSSFSVETHLINSSGVSYCFDYYSPRLHEWDIPWELLTVHLKRIHSDGLAFSMPKIDVPESKTSLTLTQMDMRIIECVRRGIISVSKIRSQLRISQQRVAERLRELRDNGLISKTWEVHNIGLSEHAFVFSKDKKVGKSIAAWALRLPRAIVSFSLEDELMLIADLPRGGSYGLATTLEGINTTCCTGILSSESYGSWGFPSTLWDSRFQKWTCPKKELETWIDNLG